MRLDKKNSIGSFALILSILCILQSSSLVVNAQRPIGFCDGCWCIPEEGEECPSEVMPLVEFSDEWLFNLREMELLNPMDMMDLSCDIYNDTTCDTSPPLEEGDACIAEIIPADDGSMCPQGFSYRLKTVPSRAEAEKNLQLVTHDGPCGTCSSFQDLAVYKSSQDLVTVGIQCGFRAIANFTDGFACYKEAGFTDGCSATWLYNSIHTNQECRSLCTSHFLSGAPANLDPPQCDLAACLECDEEESGPIFKKFAGRTRRRSGLLSAIVRPCADVGTVRLLDPCEYDTLTAPPTSSPSSPPPTISAETPASSGDEDSDDSGSIALAVNAFLLAIPIVQQIWFF